MAKKKVTRKKDKKEDGPESKTFIFRGTYINGYSVVSPQNGDPFVRVNFTAIFTKELRDNMDWEDLSDTYRNGKIKIKLHAVNLHIQPDQKEMAKFGFGLVAKELREFVVTALKQPKEDSPDENVIHFQAVTDLATAPLLHKWVQKLGRAEFQMKGDYVEKQADLDMPDEDDSQGNLLEDEAIGAEA